MLFDKSRKEKTLFFCFILTLNIKLIATLNKKTTDHNFQMAGNW